MAFYLGNDGIKRKIIINGVSYRLRIPAPKPVIKSLLALTKDGKQLKDSRGFTLKLKEN